MSRLIDADELYELIEKEFDGVCVYDVEPFEAVNDFQNIVDLAPTVDAVEVVRCKDCIEFAGEGMYCGRDILTHYDHFYCYYGDKGEEVTK